MKLAWPLFAPIAYILWTVDYYLVYFGLSFFFYKLTTGNSIIKIILILLVIPFVFLIANIFYKTTFLTSFLVTKNKIIYFLVVGLYSFNRMTSVIQYCSVKPLTISNSVVIQIPCYVNVFITFCQIILIISLGFIFMALARKDKYD